LGAAPGHGPASAASSLAVLTTQIKAAKARTLALEAQLATHLAEAEAVAAAAEEAAAMAAAAAHAVR
jgi:hypothetical protein